MKDFFWYLFYPRPSATDYGNPKVLLLLAFAALLFLASFPVELFRRKRENPITKKLMRSWSSTMRWLGGTGILLIVSRVEDIQFLSMRFLLFVWGLSLILFALFQAWKFRMKHYTILPKEYVEDPRDTYLPQK